jgi:hypothetical protein
MKGSRAAASGWRAVFVPGEPACDGRFGSTRRSRADSPRRMAVRI